MAKKATPKKVVAAPAEETSAEETSIHEVVSRLRRNGERFAPGDEIELTEIEADRLGAEVVRLKPAPAATEPAAPTPGGEQTE